MKTSTTLNQKKCWNRRHADDSLVLFRPELALCAAIVLMLLLQLVGLTAAISVVLVAFVGAVVALALAMAPWHAGMPDG